MCMEKWMADYCRRMKAEFGSRVRFIGLQGSRARCEGSESSDIDVVCILDALVPDDLRRYRAALDGIECRELVCGFLSGWEELERWETADFFTFYYDTLPFAGSLESLKNRIDAAAVERAVRIGAGNIYHGCVHNMVHERSDEVLRGLYKAASFVLRAAVYLQCGKYARKSAELMHLLEPSDREILKMHIGLKKGASVEFDKMSDALFVWAQRYLKEEY